MLKQPLSRWLHLHVLLEHLAVNLVEAHLKGWILLLQQGG